MKIKNFEKKAEKKEKDSFIAHFFVRRISKHITKILLHTNVTPNQVTFFTLLLVIIASGLFLTSNQTYLILGGFLLVISHVFDACDGEIARYRNLKSNFGKWFDTVTEGPKQYFIFAGLSIGLYLQTGNVIPLFLGMFSIGNFLLTDYIRIMNLHMLSNEAPSVINVGKKFYLGISDLTLYVVFFAIIFNVVYYILWVYATFGALMWIIKLYNGFQLKSVSN